jgi:hypothetical protein
MKPVRSSSAMKRITLRFPARHILGQALLAGKQKSFCQA